MPAGYSGTPLPRKLGLAPGAEVALLGEAVDYPALLDGLPEGVRLAGAPGPRTALVHLFVRQRAVLEAQLAALRRGLPDDVPVWVSWPKKAARVPTDVTEDVIRAVALPLGFVDVKVCAVSDLWSGLRLVVRKELRAAR